MKTRIKKRFDILVTEANKSYNQDFELDKTITSVIGIAISSDKDDLLYFRGSQKVEVNKEELFPAGYESKLLMAGVNVSPNGKYYQLDHVNPGNGIVKMVYEDADDGRTSFSPYRVSLYLDCITE